MDHRIEKILRKIENDISQKLVVRDLAASVNLSVSRLQHLFKQELGISLVKYINSLRLEKARLLLETTDLHVKEIRLKVGATHEAHFLEDFKQKFGQTPNHYRNNFRNSRIG
jgi:AraC family transcriptional regulator of arabinose operon